MIFLRWLIITLFITLPCLSQAQVVFDAKTATVTNVNAATLLTVSNLTVGSGANRGMLVTLFFTGAALPAGLTVVWDNGGTNQTMTAVPGTAPGTGHGGINGVLTDYALVAPTSGNKSLAVSWTGAQEAHATAISFTGVNQTNVATAFPNGAITIDDTATASPATVTVTSATGDIVVGGAMQSCASWGTINGTLLAEDDSTGPNFGVGSNYLTGAASVSPSFAFSGTCTWGAVGVDVKAASGGGTPNSILLMHK